MTACTCSAHRTEGTPTSLGKHAYVLDAEDGDYRNGGWRWVCGCGSRGCWQWQSENVSYHAWIDHVGRSERLKGHGS